MSNPVADLRTALRAALSAEGVTVYAYPPANPSPPCVVLVPGEPYVEQVSIGKGGLRVRYRVTLAVAPKDNPASLDQIERLITHVYAQAPQGVVLGPCSRPGLTQIGPTELLACDIDLDATITTT